MSQEEYASAFGFTINQIRDWEQGRTRPGGGLGAYLTMIDAEPEKVRDLLVAARARARRAARGAGCDRRREGGFLFSTLENHLFRFGSILSDL